MATWELVRRINGRPWTRCQIGWYIVRRAEDVNQYGEYAADYRTISVPPGRYPLYAYRDCGQPWHSLGVELPGVLKSASPWRRDDDKIGQPDTAHISPRAYNVAAAVLDLPADAVTCFELLPEVHAKRVDFINGEGKPCHTHILEIDGEKL